jgi:hypothetical protein
MTEEHSCYQSTWKVRIDLIDSYLSVAVTYRLNFCLVGLTPSLEEQIELIASICAEESPLRDSYTLPARLIFVGTTFVESKRSEPIGYFDGQPIYGKLAVTLSLLYLEDGLLAI